MKFKNFRFLTFIEILVISLVYPIAKVLISSSNKLLIFTDVIFIEGLILVLIGIIYAFYLRGDYRFSFVVYNKLFHKNISNDKFLKDDQAKRESSFNYPLLNGLFLIIVSFILTFSFF